MKLLAIDTSSKILSIAIVSDDGRFCEFTYQHTMIHAQTLMPLIEKSLESLELDICAIDAYAVSSGPGSFTGLRIGLATVKAFAYAQKKPLILVNTLEAIAYQIPLTQLPVCVLMDARNQQVYTSFFKPHQSKYIQEGDVKAQHVQDCLEALKERNQTVWVTGDAANLYREQIERVIADQAKFPFPFQMAQRALTIAHIAQCKITHGEITDPLTGVPFYLKKSSAEIKKESI